jgi:acetoin:2,6-dichlorophenolindophenol oxidoreductase subunit beta
LNNAALTTGYGAAIRDGFEHLLANHSEVFAIGQGLWSPWYVGNSMTDLDSQFGRERVIDTPVSELGCTGAALGAALCGYRPIVIHPRVDFMLLAVDQIVTQAAKWRSMFGGQVSAPITVRAIINRGGEQGAQHSQSLQSWFAHVPGLRVVMPSTPTDARDLLIASVLSDDPVLYLDDRWLYGLEEELPPIQERNLAKEGPRLTRTGADLTLVGCSYSAHLCREAAARLSANGIECDVIDLRVLNPLDATLIISSVKKTGRLLAVDGDWRACGMAAEVIASIAEALDPRVMRAAPRRVTLPDAPAPTSNPLERSYYPTVDYIVQRALALVGAQQETFE